MAVGVSIEVALLVAVVSVGVGSVGFDSGEGVWLGLAASSGADEGVTTSDVALPVTGGGVACGLGAGAPRSASPAVTGDQRVGSPCGSSMGAATGSGSSCANAGL